MSDLYWSHTIRIGGKDFLPETNGMCVLWRNLFHLVYIWCERMLCIMRKKALFSAFLNAILSAFRMVAFYTLHLTVFWTESNLEQKISKLTIRFTPKSNLLGNGIRSTSNAYDKKKYTFQIFLIHNGINISSFCVCWTTFSVLLARWRGFVYAVWCVCLYVVDKFGSQCKKYTYFRYFTNT